MDTLHIAICEDDENERRNLLKILDNSSFIIEAWIFSSGEEFLEKFEPYKFDLIFMDIFMDKLTGIDVITKVRKMDNEVSVAFITSSKDFTLESYRLDALKYIEKPVSRKNVEDSLKMAELKRQTVERLTVRINNIAYSYPLSRILYLEQKARNLLIYLRNGTVISANKKLSETEEQLLGKGFLRCHKSYIVNLAYVRGIDRELCVFEMIDGSNVYIRKRSFREIEKEFETFLFENAQEDYNG